MSSLFRMTDTEFDTALVTAAFRLAGDEGWSRLTVAKAARAAGLSLAEARARFPGRAAILLRFGRLADQAALLDEPGTAPATAPGTPASAIACSTC